MNKCIFTGRTTADIELRYANNQDQTAIGAFSLAVDDGYGDNKKTHFLNMTVFGKKAEAFQKYVPKGTKVLIDARAVQEQWKDKNGNNRTAIKFLVNDWEFAQSKGEGSAAATPSPDLQKQADDGFMDVDLEDLPFN